MNADTLLGSVGGLISHNGYAYCKNNPIGRCDPSGQSSVAANFQSLQTGYPALDFALYLLLGALGLLETWLMAQPKQLPKVPPRPQLKVIEGGLSNPRPNPTPNPKPGPGPVTVFPQSTGRPEEKRQVLFPLDPNDFNPKGLTPKRHDGSDNGAVINWFAPGKRTAIFEWDEDFEYGSHYHIREFSRDHYWPLTPVPEPYATIYFD